MNVLVSNAPAQTNYDLQSTNQGDLPVELVPASSFGGSVAALADIFWIVQGSTVTGGTAVASGTAGAFPTFAAALAAATAGQPCVLYVGAGDYSAEGMQDFAAKGVTSLSVICLPALQGVTLPPLNCDSMYIENGIFPPGAGTAVVAVNGVDFEGTNILDNVQAGNLAASRCVFGGSGNTVGTATLFNCNFSGAAFDTLTGFEVDANTLAAMGQAGVGSNEAAPLVFGGQYNYAYLRDADLTVNAAGWGLDRAILPTNTLTASRVLTVDLTHAPANGSTFTVDVYEDTSVNTLTVNGTVISTTVPQRYTFEVTAGPVLTLARQERVPSNQAPS